MLVVQTGLSLSLAIDLCIRHGLVAQLEALLFPAKEGATAAASDDSVVELLEEVSQPLVRCVHRYIPRCLNG